MTENEAVTLFKCLADKSRLRILRSLALEDMDVERLAGRLEVSAPTVSFHLKKLAEAGMVTSYRNQYYTMYSLCEAPFRRTLLDIIREESDETALQNQRDEQYRRKVLSAFFEYGKLKTIPAQRKKKRIILERLAEEFEFDRLYPEREVNLIIADFHDDFCTLRRELVGEGLMTRDKTGYRRVKPERKEEE